jgi:DNA-binding NarL/FixJ family response regulator
VNTTVLIADDQALVREGLRLIVAAAPDLQVVGDAPDGAEAVRLTAELRPQVVLMDIRMPRMDGLEATRRILSDRHVGETRVLVLTTFDLDALVYEALSAGASGFLLKESPPEQLVEGIRTVARGDALLAPSVTRRLINRFLQLSGPLVGARRLDELTTREREVLTLIGHGMSNAEIADRLVVSDATVKSHVAHLYAKLDLRDRAQAVVAAYQAGLAAGGPAPD